MFTKITKIATGLFFVSLLGFGQLKVASNGNVGIGNNNPSSKLFLEGNANGWMTQIKGTATNSNDIIGLRFLTGYPGEYGKWAGMAAITESQHSNNTGLVFYTNQSPKVWINRNGGLSVGTQYPTGMFDVVGNAYIYGKMNYFDHGYFSDKKLKTNIETSKNSLQKILQLRGVTYNPVDSMERTEFIPTNTEDSKLSGLDEKSKEIKYEKRKVKVAYGSIMKNKNRIGFIAQEIEKIFPELVHLDSNGLKTVNYIEVIPVLVEAIKEQNAKIESMEVRLRKLEKPKSGAREETKTAQNTSIAYLYQNTPNPFSQETSIKYALPETVQDAFISITDLNGKQLKSLPIATKDESTVTLKANELYAGIFVYTLVADGNIVDSKRMVIVE